MTVLWLLTRCFCGVPETVRAPEGGDLLRPLWYFFFLSVFFFHFPKSRQSSLRFHASLKKPADSLVAWEGLHWRLSLMTFSRLGLQKSGVGRRYRVLT